MALLKYFFLFYTPLNFNSIFFAQIRINFSFDPFYTPAPSLRSTKLVYSDTNFLRLLKSILCLKKKCMPRKNVHNLLNKLSDDLGTLQVAQVICGRLFDRVLLPLRLVRFDVLVLWLPARDFALIGEQQGDELWVASRFLRLAEGLGVEARVGFDKVQVKSLGWVEVEGRWWAARQLPEGAVVAHEVAEWVLVQQGLGFVGEVLFEFDAR